MDALKLTIKIPEAQSEQLLTAYSSELELAGAIENAKQIALQYFDLTLNEETKKEVATRRDKTKGALETIHNLFENKILEKCASIIVKNTENRVPHTDEITSSTNENESESKALDVSKDDYSVPTANEEQQQDSSSANKDEFTAPVNNEDKAVKANISEVKDNVSDEKETEEAQSTPSVTEASDSDDDEDPARYSTYLKKIASTNVDNINWLREVIHDPVPFTGGRFLEPLETNVIACAARARLYDLLANNKELCTKAEASCLKSDYDSEEGFRYTRSLLSSQIISLSANFSVFLYYDYLDDISTGRLSQRIKAKEKLLRMISKNEAEVPNEDRIKLLAEVERLDMYFNKKNAPAESPKSTEDTTDGVKNTDNGEQDNGQEKTE